MFLKEYEEHPNMKIFKGYKNKPHRIVYDLPYAYVINESVILNKNGSLQSTFMFRGRDLDSCTIYELESISDRLNNVLKRLQEDWAFHVEARRYKSKAYVKKDNIKEYPTLIIDQEREDFFKSGTHYESDYYITFTWFVPEDSKKKLESVFFTKSDEDRVLTSFEESKKYYENEVTNIFLLLKEIFSEIKLLTTQEMLSYYHSCVSDDEYFPIEVPKYNVMIDNYICNSRLLTGVEPMIGNKFFRVVSIHNLPNETYEGILDRLNRLAIEYRWVTRYIPLDKLTAQKVLETCRKKWFSKRMSLTQLVMETFTKSETRNLNRDALQKEEEIQQEQALIESDEAIEGYFTLSIILTDESNKILDDKCLTVKNTLNSIGFIAEIEDINNIDAFFGCVPGNVVQNIRRPPINSYHVANMLPTSAVWSGHKMNNHLKEPALVYTQTTGNTPFRLNLHYQDVGHTMIIGPNGSGKSVLLTFLVAHFLRYNNSQIIAFDKGGSSRVLCYACGGEYYDLGTEGTAPFQPLAHCDDEYEREWCREWIIDILERENVELQPDSKDMIWDTLGRVGKLAPKQRTMSTLYSLLNGQSRVLAAALGQFVNANNGPFAKYFDGDDENIKDSRFTVFEMDALSKNEKSLAPALDYIFHISEKKLDGRPTLFPYDEAWAFVKNKKAAEKMNEQLKTFRKKNASVIFASQSMADAIKSPLFNSLLDNCFTRIYLPNPTAMSEIQMEAYRTFELNDKEIEIISRITPKRQYYFKNPDGSRLFELALSDLEIAYVATAAIEEQNVAKDIYKKINSVEEFNVEWLNHKNFNGKNIIELANKIMQGENYKKDYTIDEFNIKWLKMNGFDENAILALADKITKGVKI
ncbi:hypothetical protein [Fusobacterium sp. PH5-44]|uniref:VirB4 family type IV secretion/conjugal transfer ATPase n=1 Tax=unclassified Fusobacterium TaxID=2648384 RepID=UPI003D22D3A0